MDFLLNERHRDVTEELLLQDVERVAIQLGKNTLTIEEYDANGKYHSATLRRRFGSWKDVLMLVKLDVEKHSFQISNDEYIADIKRVATFLQKGTVTNTEYRQYGKYNASKLSKRFGGWHNVLKVAELEPTGFNVSISDFELLEEIERVWIKLGRQPTTNEIRKGISCYGLTTYLRHFGSWIATLKEFINFINAEETAKNDDNYKKVDVDQSISQTPLKHKTNRDINLRLRYLVMKRDSFRCCICGASPAKGDNIDLHIDHIIPWSKGGETTLDNLQTLCSKCNLGKSDTL